MNAHNSLWRFKAVYARKIIIKKYAAPLFPIIKSIVVIFLLYMTLFMDTE